ncbi:Hsp70 family protein [Clostridium fessum]|uniref:Hsp70 family protein n=1 Tax=Clostridium fessum TaxID=2126740 RepID=UPI002A818A4D|nr:Hsp70 family protein [Clostridium fessum]MDY4928662.1 Hsp70 family protein [Clostridium fessum]
MAFEYPIQIAFAAGRKNLKDKLTIEDLRRVSEPILTAAVKPIHEALSKAHLRAEDIDLIILVGGSSQLPGIAEKIEEVLHRSPRQIPKNLMLAVAHGAALYQKETFNLPAASKKKRILGDSLGIQVQENGRRQYKILLNHNAELPAHAEYKFYLDEGQRDATIRLVTMEPDRDIKRQDLKQRTLSLTGNAREIMVCIDVDENRLIRVEAYNPKNRKEKIMLEVCRQELDENAIRERQQELGIVVDTGVIRGANVHEMCIGIDLGTTTSELSWVPRSVDDNELHTMENSDNTGSSYAAYCYPSVVYFRNGLQDVAIANSAAVDALSSAGEQNTVFSSFKTLPVYKPVKIIDGKEIKVQDLSAYVLSKIWQDARRSFGNPPSSAVITVPAAFNSDQCEATYNAAKIAGIEHVTLIDEPTAAYYYYRHVQQIDTSGIKYVLVFDFGGGTTDVAILDVKDRGTKQNAYKENEFTIKAVSGDPACGGKDIDERLFELIKNRFETQNNCVLAVPAQRKLRIEVEKAKVSLSEHYEEEE